MFRGSRVLGLGVWGLGFRVQASVTDAVEGLRLKCPLKGFQAYWLSVANEAMHFYSSAYIAIYCALEELHWPVNSLHALLTTSN